MESLLYLFWVHVYIHTCTYRKSKIFLLLVVSLIISFSSKVQMPNKSTSYDALKNNNSR